MEQANHMRNVTTQVLVQVWSTFNGGESEKAGETQKPKINPSTINNQIKSNNQSNMNYYAKRIAVFSFDANIPSSDRKWTRQKQFASPSAAI